MELSSLLVPEDRGQQKITVKLFLTTEKKEFVKDALNAGIFFFYFVNEVYNKLFYLILPALLELGAKRADLFIISWPAGITVEQGKELWDTLEDLVDKDQAYSLGVSDIDTQSFIELHSSSRVKPEAIQVNLESCCVVPPELVTFTRENNIQLLTHNDPQNILPAETLKTVISCLTEVHWIVRYQTLLRCRGIIQNKGYVISASIA